jgi:hypothetical protein
MLRNMLAAVARKDYEDRRRRQAPSQSPKRPFARWGGRWGGKEFCGEFRPKMQGAAGITTAAPHVAG